MIFKYDSNLVIERTHSPEDVGEQPVHAGNERADVLGHDLENQTDEEKAYADLDGEAEFHDVNLRRGAGHKAERHFHHKQGHHDGSADFKRQTEHADGQRDHLIQQRLPNEEPPRRDELKGRGKAADHVEVSFQRQEGQKRDHPDKEGRCAGIVAADGIGKGDHGEAHLEAQQLAARLNAHKEKVDDHAEHKADDQLAKQHDGNIKGVGGHERAGQGHGGPHAQGEDHGHGGLDGRGDILG